MNISSGVGLEGREGMGAYAAPKAALDGKHNFQSAWVIHQEGRLVGEEGRV